MKKISLAGLVGIFAIAATVYGGSALAESKEEQQEQEVRAAVHQYLTDASKANLQSLKQHLDYPMTLVATSPLLPDTVSTIRNEAEFDARFSKHSDLLDVEFGAPHLEGLATSLSRIKVQIISDELATMTYTYVRQIGNDSPPIYTVNMLTVLRKSPTETKWKVSYSTFPK